MSLRFSCFVTGTDTEIGKTLISATLLHQLSTSDLRSIGMKPVAAGVTVINGITSNDDIDALAAAGNIAMPRSLTTPYLLRTPAAPHLAAAIDGVTISTDHMLDCYARLAEQAEAIVVEGVGGFCVPLADDTDTADLAQRLNLPVVLVVGMRLGCLNHALLTAQAVRARGLTLAGWVANCVPPHMPYAQDNIATLQARLNAPLLGIVPVLPLATAAAAAQFIAPHLIDGWPVQPLR
jgi:dethiobiotin synthetase